MLPIHSPAWHEDMQAKLDLAGEMHRIGMIANDRERDMFFAAPWRWTPEWERFRRGLPLDGSKDKDNELPAYMTPVEASAYLRIPKGSLDNMRYVGDGPAYVKIGKSVYYRKTDCDAFMADNLVNLVNVG